MPERQLELRSQQRKRRPQLVAGVGHEVALAGQRRLEPAEHRVQRLAEALDLVPRVRHRQPLAGRLGRDRRRPPAHRVDRAKREARQEVPGAGRDEQRDRPGDQEHVAKLAQRLGAILERGADDEHIPVVALHHRCRQEPRGLVEARHALAFAEDAVVERAAAADPSSGAVLLRAGSSHWTTAPSGVTSWA